MILVPAEGGVLEGRLDRDLIAQLVPETDADYYLCGPAGFMAGISAALEDLGIRPDAIHLEAF